MGAEGFNPEKRAEAWNVQQPETAASAGVPKKPEQDPDKKSRKRKKRRHNRGEDGTEGAGNKAGRESGRPAAESKTSPYLGDGVIWERPKDDEPPKTGEKPDPEKTARTEGQDATDPAAVQPEKTEVPTATGAKTEPGVEPAAEGSTAENEDPAADADVKVEADAEAETVEARTGELPPEAEVVEAGTVFDAAAPPPLPPDPMTYRRRFWNEAPAMPDGYGEDHDALPPIYDYEQQAAVQSVERPAVAQQVRPAAERRASGWGTNGRAVYESDIPPGLQRSPADVTRAAWMGVAAGWWLGRRGKRKAVEQARKDGLQAGRSAAVAGTGAVQAAPYRQTPEQYRSPKLEAEPIHAYPQQELSRTVVQPLSVETHRPVAASVAVFERAVPRSGAEVPRAAQLAAARAAEMAVAGVPALMAANMERPADKGPIVRERPAGIRTEQSLGKREMMKIAKDIKIEGVTLKEVFKANRIDEEGLRAVVGAYLRGGDVKQQLSKEVVAKEQSYELDPRIRHQRRSAERDRKTGGETVGRAGKAVGQVLGHAREIAAEQGGRLAASTQNTARKASKMVASSAKHAQNDLIDNSNTADWLGITAAVVVWSIILIIWLG